ncbi:poly-gamma-glutamate synthesis protein (capsule biosynthesis protein) [Clostridium tetanomorphum]|uniref:CapA family protein n=1 Tax=Clostridium tetanomorphum TaxID=1553 RepID=A0A923J1A9_CLOTT|nr:CapA family protein [Clostridium tetanomorphum]KAJ50896.1 encapsulation protein capA [Clostridium tetanomorphum DSM 665]MBC2397148.1 CapA family protein [Clostridium tetanomorphum]MBP1863070.1 poly-gamma-glutamate synthesis protein (capsule biosynthesis protein) [Clostridium tetanomorphum]NRS82899.1 poly-gamma-glutamate synthesis protein (capsule biosynthesis protein) [Clostridium tetanomorphum]NRZ99005.1 poly-gamma-glutamate synthesis protein (capsule biosynthesis protein) [Clostridium tet
MSKKSKNKPFLFILVGLLIMIGTISYVVYYSINHSENSSKENISKEAVISKSNENKSNKKENSSKKEDIKKDVYTEAIISFAGDSTIGHDTKFAFANSLPDVLSKNNNDFSYFYKNVASIFKNDDISIVNLETTFTNSKDRAEKQFNFKADPSYAETLPLGNIEGVNISNNHIYDYKQKGFTDTLQALKANNINYFGEGNVWIKEVKGTKFGFLGYTGYNDYSEFRQKIENDIKKIKNQNAIVIINFHWGLENNYYPIETQINLAHFAIDKGADLIIGHHPHVIQGIEQYKGKIICYSLGNFCFGGNFNPKDKDTFIFQAKYKLKNGKPESYGVRVIPCSISSVNYINDYCPTPLKDSEKERLLKKLNGLSNNAGFKISDEFYNIDVKN